MDDTEDAKVLDMVEIFCQKVMSQALSKASDQLLRIVAKKRARTDDTVLQSSCPAPILPKSMDRIRFLEMDPLELARQLTLMHARTFKRIKPEEFLLKMWINPKAKHRNIRNVIGLTDQVRPYYVKNIVT